MINQKDIIADLHTHTLFSKHAYSTVKENIDEARKKGLKFVAITDHYFGNGDDLDKKNEINRIKYLEERVNTYSSDVKVIGSAEFNLGQEIYTYEKLDSMLWKPFGLHNWFVETANLSLEDVFKLFRKSFYEKGATAFVHIERELHKVKDGDILENIDNFFNDIVLFAKENNIYLEVNESSFVTNECGGVERLKKWLNIAKKNENKIYLGSDAHYSEEIGVFKNALSCLNDLEYPKELILNTDLTKMTQIFNV